jgi:nitrous oxidase accessory protein
VIELFHKTIRYSSLLVLLCIFSLSLSGWSSAEEQYTRNNLQDLIKRAKPGDTLLIQPGDYKGPLVIDKPLEIKAMNGKVRIINESNQPAIQLMASHSRLIGLEIVDQVPKSSAAIVVTGNDNLLDNLNIQTKSSGIRLRKAARNTIQKSTISWLEQKGESPTPLSNKGNGIDLWGAHENTIVESKISNMHDGLYFENCNSNRVEGNLIERSRYGIHCMYINHMIIRNNVGSYNVTGAMIMEVTNSQVIGNTFYKQSENVNSQGLLMYDVRTSVIRQNRLEDNRVGLYVERSQNNELSNNVISRNFVGLQLKDANQNKSSGNQFYANVIQAEAVNSYDNEMKGNYWDDFKGIDIQNTGYSNIPYEINPFFQKLTESIPAYQLFFQSPGMSFLESMFTANQHSWTKDISPLMKPSFKSDTNTSSAKQNTFWIGLFLLLASIINIFYLGVKRT